MGCVYLVRNKINWKGYVGKTLQKLSVRWNSHVNVSFHGRKNCGSRFSVLHSAIRKYGPENFEISVLFESDNEMELFEKEEFFIVRLGTHVDFSGYNMTFGGEGIKGYKHTEETRKKFSELFKGRKVSKKEIERLRAYNIGNTYRLGIPHSDETKRKMSIARQGEKHPNSKYSNNQVKEILAWLHAGVPVKNVAKLMNVKRSFVYDVKDGRRRNYE